MIKNINRITCYFIAVISLAIWSQTSLANCQALGSSVDQQLCYDTVQRYGIKTVELWNKDETLQYSTYLEQKAPKLVVIEGRAEEGQRAVFHFNDLERGRLDVQKRDQSISIANISGQVLKLKMRNSNSSTLMLVLTARSEIDDLFGSGMTGNSTMPTGGDNTSEAVNPVAIIVPASLFVFAHLLGWYRTITDIYDVYFFAGGGRASLSTPWVIISAIATCGANLIPHFIFYKVKRVRPGSTDSSV